MSKTCQAFILILLTVTPWLTVSANESVKEITLAQLMQVLPSDADLKNIKRQQKAFQRGLYWTKSKTLKHLDTPHSAT